MTDDAALIARLRDYSPENRQHIVHEAADRIAAQAGEIAALTRDWNEWDAESRKWTAERDAARDDLAMAKTKADEFDRMNELRQKAMAERDARPAREPTDAMLRAGLAAWEQSYPGFNIDRLGDIWAAMYDAARREQKP